MSIIEGTLGNQTYLNNIFTEDLDVFGLLISLSFIAILTKCSCTCYNRCSRTIKSYYNTQKLETIRNELMKTSSCICSICLEDYSDDSRKIFKLQCNHVFHDSCIGAWLSNNNNCPECRTEI